MIELSTDNKDLAKIVVKNKEGSIYTKIMPTGIKTFYEDSLLFWVNGTATNIRDINGKGVVFAGNSFFIRDDISSNDYPIQLTGTDGKIICTTLQQTSLAEKKKNIKKMSDNALEAIKSIDIYKYNLKNEEDTDKKHIGFVIGEGYNYSKEVTSTDNEGVDNYSFTSLCCKAIQEQQKQIEKLIKEIQELKGAN